MEGRRKETRVKLQDILLVENCHRPGKERGANFSLSLTSWVSLPSVQNLDCPGMGEGESLLRKRQEGDF